MSLVIEDFNDQDFTEYNSGSPSEAGFDTTSPIEGAASVYFINNGDGTGNGTGTTIYSATFEDLPKYVGAGDEWGYYVKDQGTEGDGNGFQEFRWCGETDFANANGYAFQLRLSSGTTGTPDPDVRLINPDPTTLATADITASTGTWYFVHIKHDDGTLGGANGDITIDVYEVNQSTGEVDMSSSILASPISVNDTTRSSGGQGYQNGEFTGGQREGWFDYLRERPDAASALSATAASSTQIDLAWTENDTTITDHIIERSTDGGSTWSEHDTVAQGTTTYQDTGLSASTTYHYRIKSTDNGFDAEVSNEDSATTASGTITLTAGVGELSLSGPASPIAGTGNVNLTAGVGELTLSGPEITIGAPVWMIDSVPIPDHISEFRTWRSLDLTFRVNQSTLKNYLEPLKDTAEKLEVIPASDGTFSVLDRASTDGVYTLTPPLGRDPPRTRRDYLIGSYSQRPIDQDVSNHEVSVSFTAKSNRDPDGNTTDETRSVEDWVFDFRSARISTKRVTADVPQGTDTAADVIDLTLILTASQTKILEESVTRLDAVSIREVPDGANTVDDDSGSPINANTVTVTPRLGHSLDFDGSDDYVDIGTPSDLQFTASDDFSIACRINSDEWTSDRHHVVSSRDGDSNFTALFGIDGSRFQFNVNGDSESNVVETTPPSTGNWHHAAGTYRASDSRVELWIDGVSKGTDASSTLTGNLYTDWAIGRRQNTSLPRWFDGRIDDVPFYNRVITDSEVGDLAAGTPVPTGQVARFPFDEGSGTTATDPVGSNDGTINGASYATGVTTDHSYENRVTPGEYVVLGWQTEWLSSDGYRVNMRIGKP